MTNDRSREFAESADAQDPLRTYRERFHIPQAADGREAIYFCGNSLGLQPKTVQSAIEEELDDWRRLAVDGHAHARRPWMSYHECLTHQTARVVGALPHEVINMNSLTVNLHLMMVTFYQPSGDRTKILIERGAFPSDRYAVVSQLSYHGLNPEDHLIELAPRPGNTCLHPDDVLQAIETMGHDLALILLGGVNYYTGQCFDLCSITEAGHRQGCFVGFDLAHAAGNVPLQLHEWNVDFAVWCSYKYLNSGPGGIAGCFIHEQHASNPGLPRFAGWWGHDKNTRFLMGPDFFPMPTAEGWQLSNPPIFQMASLRASLDIFDECGMAALRRKSEHLTGYVEFLLEPLKNVTITTPNDPDRRGCQLSLRVANGRSVHEKLTARGVVCDWREPDVIRIAPVPLYNTFVDVHTFASILGELSDS